VHKALSAEPHLILIESPSLRRNILLGSSFDKFKLRVFAFLQKWSYLINQLKKPPEWNINVFPFPHESERCVEISWCANTVKNTYGLWLDIGYAHAESRFWKALEDNSWKRHWRLGLGLDVATARRPFPLALLVQENLIESPLEHLPPFNVITCISTLEHIGCDNQLYHKGLIQMGNPRAVQKQVFQKLWKKLFSGGKFLISLPFGKFEDHGWFLQYDETMLAELVRSLPSKDMKEKSFHYFKTFSDGWRRVLPSKLKKTTYETKNKRAGGVVLIEITKM